MPRIDPLFPEVALQHEQKYGANIHEFKEGYFFSVPVCVDDTVDLSFLDPCKPLKVDSSIAMKDMKIVVADGMKVTAVDHSGRQYKVMVETDTGSDQYKARNAVHRSQHSSPNINCKIDMEVPKSPEFDQLVKEVKYFSDIMNGSSAGKIACRHLVMESILAKQETYATGRPWRSSFNETHQAGNIQDRFKDFIKSELDAYDLLFLAENVYQYDGGIEQMPAAFAALLQTLRSDAQMDEKTELHRDYIVGLMDSSGHATNHVLHASLKVRQEGDDWLYKVKLYDPNETFLHRSLTATDLRAVQTTEVQDWIGSDYSQVYSKCYDTVYFFESKENWKDNLNGDDQRNFRNLHELLLDGKNPNPVKFLGREIAPPDIALDAIDLGLLKTELPK